MKICFKVRLKKNKPGPVIRAPNGYFLKACILKNRTKMTKHGSTRTNVSHTGGPVQGDFKHDVEANQARRAKKPVGASQSEGRFLTEGEIIKIMFQFVERR